MKFTLNSPTGSYPIDLQFGTDAEFFLFNKETGDMVAASKVIPGTKENPHQLDNGVCHPDGLSLEVGCPPASTPLGMVQNLFAVLTEVREKYLVPNGVEIHPTHRVDIKDFPSAGKTDLEFGCGTEWMAYSLQQKLKGDAVSHLRFSGFHIHLGFTNHEDSHEVRTDMSSLIRALDKRIKAAGLGTCGVRTQQYGGYGAFRVKPYGTEYRAMDCRAVLDPRKLTKLVDILQDMPAIFSEATQSSRQVFDRCTDYTPIV